MGQRPFVFVLHHHQPVGNFEAVFEAAYTRCYEPVLSALEQAPAIRVGLHYSGPLIEWLVRAQRPFLDRVRRLVERGQVEILGGGFYEPILISIPENDALGQLEMMASSTERYFGVRPAGIWLAERVWDSDLPRLLGAAGVRYTLVDDHLFARTGAPKTGTFLTEKAGQPLGLFAIDQGLRYRIPFATPEEVLRHIVEAPGDGCVTYGDDAEKFGLWPRSFEWVHQKGWLGRWLAALTQAQEERKIATVLPAEHLASAPPGARVYLPDGAYEELTRWALPEAVQLSLASLEGKLSATGLLAEARPFLAGAPWAAFLGRYSEANRLHKKMIEISMRLGNAMDDALADGKRIEGDLADQLGTAQRELYKAQCCCAYWHGLFGGIYLSHLRSALYAALLEAEVILDRLQAGEGDWIGHEVRDFDLDGRDEVLLANRSLDVYVAPAQGGAIEGLHSKATRVCLTDVMTRRSELYHQQVRRGGRAVEEGAAVSGQAIAQLKEPNLAELLFEDDRARATLVDRFYATAVELDAVRRSGAADLGDFAKGPYRVESLLVDEAKDSTCVLSMSRNGSAAGRSLSIDKTLELGIDEGRVVVRYRLVNRSAEPLSVRFGSELNFNLLAPDDPGRFVETPAGRVPFGSSGVIEGERIDLVDETRGVALAIDATASARWFRYPIETVSQSEAGFERTFQGTCFVPTWPVELAAGEELEVGLSLTVREIRR